MHGELERRRGLSLKGSFASSSISVKNATIVG